MTRNVLVVAYYFPPMGLSGVQRTLKFVKYLPEYGWHPIVLTCAADAYYAFDETLADDIDNNRITIVRTDSDLSKMAKPKNGNTIKYPSYFSQKIKRMISQTIFQPDSRISWKKLAVAKGQEIIDNNEIHAIFSTAPPFTDFLVAQELSEKNSINYVMDYRDLWVDNAYYFYATPFHKSYSMDLERKMLTHSKRAIVINRFMKEKMLQRYKFLSHDDISIIPHGYDKEDFDAFSNVRPDSSKFTITHCGLFPDDLTPKYFLKALSNYLKKNPDAKSKISARFVGLMRKSHIKMFKKYKLLDIVESTGYVSHSEAIRNLMESDVLWFMIPNNIATPSRMYEYFGARKPMIVCAPDGNIKQTALESAAALCPDPKNIKQIEEAIDNYFNLWKQGRLPQPDKKFIDQFDRKKLTSLLARELALAAVV